MLHLQAAISKTYAEALFQELNGQGITILMVTHEPDIGAHTKRRIVVRNGLIASDERVARPIRAVDLLKTMPLPESQVGDSLPTGDGGQAAESRRDEQDDVLMAAGG